MTNLLGMYGLLGLRIGMTLLLAAGLYYVLAFSRPSRLFAQE